MCDPGWIYDNVSNQGKVLKKLYPTQADYNGSSSNATMKLTASVTATVKVEWSGGYSLDANVIVVGVKQTINGSVAVSITVTGTNEIDITIPPYKTGYGDYGVWRQKAYGHYYYLSSTCKITTDYGYVTTYSPWYVGWNTWIG